MDLGLTDKTIVVTGAASGIGAATARLLVAENARVVLLDINESAGRALAISLGEQARFFPCDVSNGEAVRAVFAQLESQYSVLDGLVNNAGLQTYGSITDTTEADWHHTLAVNLTSVFLCSKYAMPALLRSANPVIINVSSVQALVSQTGASAYITAKAGLLGLTRSIAIDFAPRLRCVAVCPGAVDTPMLQDDLANLPNRDALIRETEAIHLLDRIATPDEIARFIVFLTSPQASFATGQYYRVDGGIGVKIAGQ